MIMVEKIGDKNYPDIKISDETNSFVIARNNLPDPCWYPEINYFKCSEDITFTIEEEDGDIYTFFNRLYQDIIDGNIFPLTDKDTIGKSSGDLERLNYENEIRKMSYREEALRSGLVSDGVISWHSEDYDDYDFASILTIKKADNQIGITFSRNKENTVDGFVITHPTYNVRITEVGGRYGFFHIIFVNFHRQLQNFNWGSSSIGTGTIPKEYKKVLREE